MSFIRTTLPYLQFFTIHGEVNDHVLKLASGLLSTKTTAAYEEVFQSVGNRIQALTGQMWVVREMVTDFETAIMNAAENIFPGIQVNGCYFHFAKALWHKVQQIGLAQAYRQDANIRMFIRKVMAIGFLPLNIVRLNWNGLRNSHQTRALTQLYPALRRFIVYFQNTWMNRNGAFRPARWNVWGRPMEYRTNNAVESYNRAWNWFVATRRPSIWHFITKLKQRQTLHQVQVNNMQAGVPAPRRQRKWRKLERRIRHLKRDYRNGRINVDRYWTSCVHWIQRYR